MVSLKNAPLAFFPNNSVTNTFDNQLSSRMRNFELAVMSTASLVYNVVFATVFSVLSLVTLGQVQALRDQMNKQWTHTALAAMSIVIGMVGTVSPYYGVLANGGAIALTAFGTYKITDSSLATNIPAVYQRYSQELKDAALASVNGNQAFYDRRIAPLFNYLDRNLNDQVQDISDLFPIFGNALDQVDLDEVGPLVQRPVFGYLDRFIEEFDFDAIAGVVFGGSDEENNSSNATQRPSDADAEVSVLPANRFATHAHANNIVESDSDSDDIVHVDVSDS
jgi:hypothetical protein